MSNQRNTFLILLKMVQYLNMWRKSIKIQVEVSARHCHLSEKDLATLFGADKGLTKLKQLSQPSDFACQETVDIEFGSKKIEKVRIVGPARGQTQVEISLSDAIDSGLVPPLRISGDLQGSAGVTLYGPKGSVELKEGLIISKRHLHCATKDAEKYKLKNSDIVSVEISGQRTVIFKDIPVRVNDNYSLSLHLDADEGNAAGINRTGEGLIIKNL